MMNKLVTCLVLACFVAVLQLPTAAVAVAATDAKKQLQQIEAAKKARKAKAARKEKAAKGKKKKKAKHATQLTGKKTSAGVLKAFEVYETGDLDGAISILGELKPDKKYDKAYVARYLGIIYYQRGKDGDLDTALKKLKFAVDANILSDVEHGQGIMLLANLQMEKKLYKKSLDNYYKWLAFTEKEEAIVYVKITQANYLLEEFDKVIGTADKAIALFKKPDRNPYILKIQSYYHRKMFKEAIKVLETVLQIFPKDKEWWIQLGSFYSLIEDYDKAAYTLDLAYKQGFLVTQSHIKTLVSLYSTTEVPFKAATLLEEHIDSGLVTRDERTIGLLANAWHSATNIGKAAKYYGELAQMTNESRYYRKQGVLLKQDQQFSAAVKALNKSLDLGHKDPGKIQLAIAESYFYLEKYKLAYKAVKEAVKDPKARKYAKPWLSHIKSTAARKKVSLFK